jgi:hypothetical protein
MTNDKPTVLNDADLDVSGAGPVGYGEDGPKIITRHGEVDAENFLATVRARYGGSVDKGPGVMVDITREVEAEHNL